ncbi:hypothetical protein ACFQU2_40330 [Siccirubricoccus deserti]
MPGRSRPGRDRHLDRHPYLCALAAAWLGLSVVVLIMAAALTVSAARVDRETGAPGTSPEALISAVAFWEVASLLVSSLLYFLAGRALLGALSALDDWPLWHTAGAAAAILVLVLGIEFLAGLASAVEPRAAGATRRRVVAAAVLAWASTRSVIGLIVALSVPAVPGIATERDLVLVVATLVVLGSVLVQGMTLGPAVGAAALGDATEEQQEQELAVRAARDAAAEAGEGGYLRRRSPCLHPATRGGPHRRRGATQDPARDGHQGSGVRGTCCGSSRCRSPNP